MSASEKQTGTPAVEELTATNPAELDDREAEAVQGGVTTDVASATGGAGAGKIKFNEFTIKKTSDKA